MNRLLHFALGTLLIAALTAPAQQTASGPIDTNKGEHGPRSEQGTVPNVDQQLKILTERLALTADQQTKVRPILQQMDDAMQKLVQGKNLSHEERLARVRPLHYKADKQIREVLTDDQQKKLDQFEQEPHPEMHGGQSGAPAAPQSR